MDSPTGPSLTSEDGLDALIPGRTCFRGGVGDIAGLVAPKDGLVALIACRPCFDGDGRRVVPNLSLPSASSLTSSTRPTFQLLPKEVQASRGGFWNMFCRGRGGVETGQRDLEGTKEGNGREGR